MVICWGDVWRIRRVRAIFHVQLNDSVIAICSLVLSCNSSTRGLLTACLIQSFWCTVLIRIFSLILFGTRTVNNTSVNPSHRNHNFLRVKVGFGMCFRTSLASNTVQNVDKINFFYHKSQSCVKLILCSVSN